MTVQSSSPVALKAFVKRGSLIVVFDKSVDAPESCQDIFEQSSLDTLGEKKLEEAAEIDSEQYCC